MTLVERLHEIAKQKSVFRATLNEAADRIEALEAALRGLYEFNVKHQPDLIDTRVMLVARAALTPEPHE